MKVDDITKLDWKKDKTLMAVQQKLAGFAERETQDRSRLADSSRSSKTQGGSIVQARAAEMLGEKTDESADEIQERLESARREIVDLQANLEALSLARTRLEPAVKAAASEAKERVAAMLMPMYRDTTEALRAQLEKAAELNKLLHVVHSHTLKQDLRQEVNGNPVLKPLGLIGGMESLDDPQRQPFSGI